jgi:ATP/ADP translocase
MHIFPTPKTRYSDCDKAKDFLTKAGLSFQDLPEVPGETVVTKIGSVELHGYSEDKYKAALKTTSYPATFDKSALNWPMTILILFILVIYVTMVYGPIAAFLVELFPTRIRYTSMSLPYHIGNGWFGGMLPLLATAIVASRGNIYAGLWYPIIVALMSFVIGSLFIRETKDRDIRHDF